MGGPVGLGNHLTANLTQALGGYDGHCLLCSWHPCWHSSATAYYDHWQRAVQNLLPSKLNAINLKPATQYNNTVAVHARCSDVPFNKHPIYHLPAPSYWSWAIATLLKATSVREAIVHHNGRFGIVSGSRAGACNALARSMCDALLRAGFRSCILAPAMSDREAFEAMLGSAALLTTMPSSFSLLPGLSIATRNPTSFITPLFYAETSRFDDWYKNVPH